jgi:hypothetical protein
VGIFREFYGDACRPVFPITAITRPALAVGPLGKVRVRRYFDGIAGAVGLSITAFALPAGVA